MAGPTLFLMFGYPGSGKSTFARYLADTLPAAGRVSYDELRERIWPEGDAHDTPDYQTRIFGALDYATERLLTTGISVIYDVNNNRREQLASIAELAGRCKAGPVTVWVQTPLEVAREREVTRLLTENHRMSPEKFQRLVDSMEEPGADERIIIINGEATIQEQYASFGKQLAEL